jgi:lipopolysaccharide export LptBFGC system permease protein LptF
MLLLGMSLETGDALQNFLASRLRLGAQTGNTLVAAGVGLLISVAYWFSYTFFLTLGYTGAIPPPIAPWIVPACFGGMTAFLYSTIPE